MSKSKINIATLSEYLDEEYRKFLDIPNVNAVGIGLKSKHNILTNEISIRFAVQQKLDERSIEIMGSRLLPKHLEIAGEKIPTDIVERNYEFDTAKTRNEKTTGESGFIAPGGSIGLFRSSVSYGTFGAIVYRNDEKYALSCGHVFKRKDKVCFPAVRFDPINREKNVIGRVIEAVYEPVDCAIAKLLPNAELSRKLEHEIFGLGVIPSVPITPKLNDRVVKSGSRTQVTEGIVTCIDLRGCRRDNTEFMGFEVRLPKSANPANELSKKGDSGSAVMLKIGNKVTNKIAGLLVSGDRDTNYLDEWYLANYITDIQKVLKIDLKP